MTTAALASTAAPSVSPSSARTVAGAARPASVASSRAAFGPTVDALTVLSRA